MNIWYRKMLKPLFTHCHYCTRAIYGKQVTTDHVVPLVKGGADEPSNFVYCCIICNVLKTDMDYDRFLYLIKILPISKDVPLPAKGHYRSEDAAGKYIRWWSRAMRMYESMVEEKPLKTPVAKKVVVVGGVGHPHAVKIKLPNKTLPLLEQRKALAELRRTAVVVPKETKWEVYQKMPRWLRKKVEYMWK